MASAWWVFPLSPPLLQSDRARCEPARQRLASAGGGGLVRVWEAMPVPDRVWRQRGLVSQIPQRSRLTVQSDGVELAILWCGTGLESEARQWAMLTDWQHWFPDCEPVAHHLPVVFPERWVRFHSLPSSKRYPEDADEYATLIERHNRILCQLARPDQSLALLTTGYSETAEPVRCQRELSELDPLALPWRTVAMHRQADNFPEPTFWHVFVSKWGWSPGVFDPLVVLIAENVLSNIMIVALDCRWLLHPYDGGMDLIVESRTVRDSFAKQHPEWLAPEWLAAGEARDVGFRLRSSIEFDS